MVKQRLADILGALRSWPDAGGWIKVGRELIWALPLLLAVAGFGNLIRFSDPPGLVECLKLAVLLLVAPSLGEELLFRAAIIPRDGWQTNWIAVSTLLFVAWHPLQVVLIGPPWANSFLDPWFLATVAVLGLALARIYAVSGSIWPCVITHWAIVMVWKTLLGGPF